MSASVLPNYYDQSSKRLIEQTSFVPHYLPYFSRNQYARYTGNFSAMRDRCWKGDANSMPSPIYTNPSSCFQYSGPMRTFYMPSGSTTYPQSHTGALSIPPFLFNRMSQVLHSLPFPPPLPQMSLFPVSFAIQQMIPQQYPNPVAVFSYTSNCSVTSDCPPIVPLQQQAPYLYKDYLSTSRVRVPPPPPLNRSVATRPWLHEMPPLPPGAVIISDEFIPRSNITDTSHFFPMEYPRVFNSELRSMIPRGISVHRNRMKSQRRRRKKPKNKKFQSSTNCSSIAASSITATPARRRTSSLSSSSSSSSTCVLCRAERAKERTKLDLNSKSDKQKRIYSPPPPSTKASHVNLDQSNSISLSNSPLDNEIYTVIPTSAVSINSIEKQDQKLEPATPSEIKQPWRKLTIIPRFRKNSPSIINAIQSHGSVQLLNIDSDAITTTSSTTVSPREESDKD